MSTPDVAFTSQVGQLYRAQSKWLHNWLRPRVNCSHLAADLVQDVFVRVMSAADAAVKLEAVREPKGYLATIARRLMIDHLRRVHLERAWLQVLAEQPEALDISPEQRLALLQTLFELDAMLASLGPKVREAFLLSQIDGMPYKHIATQLGISEVSVRRYIAKAAEHCMIYSLGHDQ
ncbi:sigma-70 family RNA polymerase sigma factor [Pseudomonas sp. WOUb67]|uniref:sigma-70 family RNA polymerase sigma factor n=1 Tax=Pseudomonas sp. WOUb67 TaxID=3161136 RepID=UPI003CEC9EB4